MARQILRSGRRVDLIIFDAVEPRDMSRQLTMVERLLLVPKLHPQVLIEWPKHRLRAFLRNRSITPRDLVGEAYIRAQCAYRPQPYAGDMYLIRALRAFTHHVRSGPTLGWQKLVSGKIEVCDIDCTHFELFENPAVSQVAAAVRKRLDLRKADGPIS
jgi:thioesterase domain-containing protein